MQLHICIHVMGLCYSLVCKPRFNIIAVWCCSDEYMCEKKTVNSPVEYTLGSCVHPSDAEMEKY